MTKTLAYLIVGLFLALLLRECVLGKDPVLLGRKGATHGLVDTR
jgi:hypothetical protein